MKKGRSGKLRPFLKYAAGAFRQNE